MDSMSINPKIDILLATYNGEKYLPEQIDSILCQTYENWNLIVRDDGSSDNTVRIIKSYRDRYNNKITLVEDKLGNLGVCNNFAKLLEYSNAEFVMFCDQDDVWLPRKIELEYKKMQDLIKRYGSEIPLLVYTDMKVVNESLLTTSTSFWTHSTLNPRIGKSLSRLLVCNVASGCTMMFNKKLRDLSLPLPGDVLMHDWWLNLLSVSLGKNDYISEPTVLYRQHVMNKVGARWNASVKPIIAKLMEFEELKRKNKEHLINTQRQAMIIASRYKDILNRGDLKKILTYANLNSLNCIMKRYYVIRYGFWWAGTIRSVTLLLII